MNVIHLPLTTHLVKSSCLWFTLIHTLVLPFPVIFIGINVDFVSAKATRTLNFVRHNIYRCPPDVKTLSNTSLIRPHLEFASAAWDPYTARDINQLDKVQRRAARFVKNDYRRTTSVSGLVKGWQSLEDRRKNSRLALFYKGLHGLSAIPCDLLRRPVRNSWHPDSDTFTILSSRLDCYKFSFFPRTISEWNKLSQDVRSKSSIVSFRSALLKPPGPVENNFWAMALRQ